MIFSSSAPAWPDTCTRARLLSYTSAPILASWLTVSYTHLEDLISQRIHELPEVGHFPAAAGEISVDPIGAGDENEDTGGDDALRLHGDARQALSLIHI